MLDLFERVRKSYPTMTNFHRFKEELALETGPADQPTQWMAVRSRSVRTGVLNPENGVAAYGLHQTALELAPFYLSISPLDIDYLEILYGFDLQASGNHDAIVAEALFANSPLASLLEISGATPSDCQPVFGVTLGEPHKTEMYYEIKTRPSAGLGPTSPGGDNSESGDAEDAEQRFEDPGGGGEPISVYVTLRRHGPFLSVDELKPALERLVTIGESLIEEKVAPNLLQPIREAISSGS